MERVKIAVERIIGFDGLQYSLREIHSSIMARSFERSRGDKETGPAETQVALSSG